MTIGQDTKSVCQQGEYSFHSIRRSCQRSKVGSPSFFPAQQYYEKVVRLDCCSEKDQFPISMSAMHILQYVKFGILQYQRSRIQLNNEDIRFHGILDNNSNIGNFYMIIILLFCVSFWSGIIPRPFGKMLILGSLFFDSCSTPVFQCQ